ncbi:hypothetical protein FIBSPDRAFT_991841 [Athelia psychrophila]|uniref:Uncharacterized protein n=1 Tax=Athelia psychrophila TaxID=1759441 RepID=A0A165YXP7_9AGAM|nr:hypothetical protein FIBSPDRAFT_991841 [Fibularhizoctonia sp. CBS 109695]
MRDGIRGEINVLREIRGGKSQRQMLLSQKPSSPRHFFTSQMIPNSPDPRSEYADYFHMSVKDHFLGASSTIVTLVKEVSDLIPNAGPLSTYGGTFKLRSYNFLFQSNGRLHPSRTFLSPYAPFSTTTLASFLCVRYTGANYIYLSVTTVPEAR